MALISISTGLRQLTNSINFEIVEFDGFMQVSPNTSTIVTTRPAESGYDYNDAVHNQATTLNCSIYITDTAQTLLDSRKISDIANIAGTKFTESYVKKQLDKLYNFQNNRYKVSLESKYGSYEDYIITNVTYEETSDQALQINFSMIETRQGTVETTDNNTAGTYSRPS